MIGCWMLSAAWAAPGPRLVPQVGHQGMVTGLVYSADGTRLLTVSRDGTAAVWDVASHALVLHIHDGDDRLIGAGFIGDAVLTASTDGTLATWDVRSGERAGVVETKATWTSAVVVDGGARVLAVDDQDRAAAWSTNTGRKGLVLKEKVTEVWSHTAAADGKSWVARTGEQSVGVFRSGNGELARGFTLAGSPTSAALGPDGAELITCTGAQTATVWSTKTGKELSQVEGGAADATVVAARLGPDRVALTTGDGDLIVRDRKAGAERARATGLGSDGLALAPGGDGVAVARGAAVALWAPSQADAHWLAGRTGAITALSNVDGPLLATGAANGEVTVWNLGSGAPQSRHTAGDASVTAITLLPTWRMITITSRGEVALFAHRTGPHPLVQLAPLGRELNTRAALSRDGNALIVATLTGTQRWSVPAFASFQRAMHGQWWATGGTSLLGKGDPNAIELVSRWPPPGALQLGDDGTVRVLQRETGQEVGALYAFADGGWAVVDREGRFDASNDGDVDGVVWVIAGQPYRLSQLRDRYYEPGLLAKLLGNVQEPMREVPSIQSIEVPPAIHTEGPSSTGSLEIRVRDGGTGIGRVHATLNGIDFSDALLGQCPTLRSGSTCTLDLTRLPTWLPGGDNHVVVEAASANDVLRARGLDVYVQASGTPVKDPPDLWVLAVGTSEYAGEALDLAYAAEDARSVGAALAIAGVQGFGPDRVHVRVLSTAAGDGVFGAPSRAALDEGFAWLTGADLLDTVVVFFSGHGAAHTDSAVDDYFYLLSSAASFSDLRDPGLRSLRAFSGQELAAALGRVPALKRLVILDTCAAGKMDGDIAGRALSSDVIRAHAASRERTGAWLLAGAAADQVSYEASRFKQGVLTYSLLEGMRGPALDDANLLLVSRWLQFAVDQVPQHAEGIGGVQQPITRRGSADDFPLGALPPTKRGEIVLQPLRPIVVRSNVVGRGGRQDALGCGAAIDEALRDEAAKAEAPFVQWSSAPTPDTWQVSGVCATSTAGVVFDGYFSQTGAAAPKSEAPLKAQGGDVAEMSARVVGATVRLLTAQ